MKSSEALVYFNFRSFEIKSPTRVTIADDDTATGGYDLFDSHIFVPSARFNLVKVPFRHCPIITTKNRSMQFKCGRFISFG
jgi:hypothetical protein